MKQKNSIKSLREEDKKKMLDYGINSLNLQKKEQLMQWLQFKKTKKEMFTRKKIITIWYNYSREQFLVFFTLPPNFIKKFLMKVVYINCSKTTIGSRITIFSNCFQIILYTKFVNIYHYSTWM